MDCPHPRFVHNIHVYILINRAVSFGNLCQNDFSLSVPLYLWSLLNYTVEPSLPAFMWALNLAKRTYSILHSWLRSFVSTASEDSGWLHGVSYSWKYDILYVYIPACVHVCQGLHWFYHLVICKWTFWYKSLAYVWTYVCCNYQVSYTCVSTMFTMFNTHWCFFLPYENI